MRAFIAAQLPEKVKEEIEEIKDNLGLGQLPLTWVKKDRLHLTILFLGEIKEEQVEPVKEILTEETSALYPIKVGLSRLGGFPDSAWPKIIWLGLTGETEVLAKLAQGLREKVGKLGISLDPKTFTAHLTLGRVKRWAGRGERKQIGQKVAGAGLGEATAFNIEKITFFKSRLTEAGPIYEALVTAKLKNLKTR